MIQYPQWPVLGGGPRISGAVVALATDDTFITGPTGPNPAWTDGVGWDPAFWSSCWDAAFADLQDLFELPWGQLQDKLYWYVTAPSDPEAPGAPDYQSGAVFMRDQLINYLGQTP